MRCRNSRAWASSAGCSARANVHSDAQPSAGLAQPASSAGHSSRVRSSLKPGNSPHDTGTQRARARTIVVGGAGAATATATATATARGGARRRDPLARRSRPRHLESPPPRCHAGSGPPTPGRCEARLYACGSSSSKCWQHWACCCSSSGGPCSPAAAAASGVTITTLNEAQPGRRARTPARRPRTNGRRA